MTAESFYKKIMKFFFVPRFTRKTFRRQQGAKFLYSSRLNVSSKENVLNEKGLIVLRAVYTHKKLFEHKHWNFISL